MSSSSPKPFAGADAGDPVHSPEATWTEKDEVRLLKSVLEIAEESAESFDPSVSPFVRIGESLKKPFTRTEMLAKVKELRRSYEEKCYKIRIGGVVGAYNSAVFEISNRIWGPGVKVMKKKNKNKKKKKKKIRGKTKKKVA